MMKFTLTESTYIEHDNSLEIYLNTEEKLEKINQFEIYQLAISSLYLYSLSKHDQNTQFSAYDLSATMQHVPNIMCILEYDIFKHFVEHPLDLFIMLEILTFQAKILINNEDEVVNMEKFQNLNNQYLLAKIRTYKAYIPSIDKEHMNDLEAVFNAFDGNKLAFVDFKIINKMLLMKSVNYEDMNNIQLKDLIKKVLANNKNTSFRYKIFLEQKLIYSVET